MSEVLDFSDSGGNSQSANPKDIASLLDSYSNPATVNQTVDNTKPPAANNPAVEYYKTGKKAGQPKPPKKVSVSTVPPAADAEISGEIFTGTLFITLIDMLFPFLIVLINNKVSDKKIEMEVLQLTAKQKKAIDPVADKVVEQLRIKGNPVLILTIAMVGMYAMNFAMVKQLAK